MLLADGLRLGRGIDQKKIAFKIPFAGTMRTIPLLARSGPAAAEPAAIDDAGADTKEYDMFNWASAAPAVTAAFLASLVEVVEAFTIVLAVGTVRGWRPALLGTGAALGFLTILVIVLGPALDQVPLHLLQLVIGTLLLLFGMRWLRKAILRAAGLRALHDEELAFREETIQLSAQVRPPADHLDWLAGLTAFKAVTLEGLEVVFIVIAVGAGRGLLIPASLGALAACALVLGIGVIVHRPLARVPENTLKFGVGVMLSAFGVYWTGEGLGVSWPGGDLAILAFGLLFVLTGILLVNILRRRVAEAAS